MLQRLIQKEFAEKRWSSLNISVYLVIGYHKERGNSKGIEENANAIFDSKKALSHLKEVEIKLTLGCGN